MYEAAEAESNREKSGHVEDQAEVAVQADEPERCHPEAAGYQRAVGKIAKEGGRSANKAGDQPNGD